MHVWNVRIARPLIMNPLIYKNIQKTGKTHYKKGNVINPCMHIAHTRITHFYIFITKSFSISMENKQMMDFLEKSCLKAWLQILFGTYIRYYFVGSNLPHHFSRINWRKSTLKWTLTQILVFMWQLVFLLNSKIKVDWWRCYKERMTQILVTWKSVVFPKHILGVVVVWANDNNLFINTKAYCMHTGRHVFFSSNSFSRSLAEEIMRKLSILIS